MINDSQIKVSYTLTQAGQVLPVPFYFLENGHLLVSKNGEPLEIGTDYNVSGAGNESGGAVTMIGGVDGDSVFIIREVPESQLTEYRYNERFPSESMERSLDKLTMIAQQNADRSSRSIRIPADESTQTILPAATERADKILVFDADGNVDPRTTDEVVGPVVEEVEELVNEARGYRNESSDFASAAKESEENADESAEKALEQADRAKGYADGIEEAIALKADLDPDTGRLVDEQLPEAIEAKILLRFGTRSELDNAIPPLAENEPAYETDTGFYRLGATRYPNLAFMQAEIDTAIDTAIGNLNGNDIPGVVLLNPGVPSASQSIESSLSLSGGGAENNREFSIVDNSGVASLSAEWGLFLFNSSGTMRLLVEAGIPTLSWGKINLINQISLPAGVGTLLLDSSPLPAANLTGEVADTSIPDTIARAGEINRTKQPRGGVYFEREGWAVIPGITPASLSVGSFTLSWCGKVTAVGEATVYGCLLGNVRGVSTYHYGSVGLAISTNGRLIFVTEDATLPFSQTRIISQLEESMEGKVTHVIGTYDHTTGEVNLYQDGQLVGSGSWLGAVINSIRPIHLMTVVSGNGTPLADRSVAGDAYHAAIFNGVLSAAEIAGLVASGGQIVPLSARPALLADLAMNAGNGYQLRDRSGNGNHALLKQSDFTHLIPKDGAPVSATGVDASSATYLLRSGPVLPSGAIVTGVIVDGEYLPASGAQSSAQTRIRLNPTGGDIEVQRSDGSTHTPIATFTPASLASVDVKVISQSAP